MRVPRGAARDMIGDGMVLQMAVASGTAISRRIGPTDTLHMRPASATTDDGHSIDAQSLLCSARALRSIVCFSLLQRAYIHCARQQPSTTFCISCSCLPQACFSPSIAQPASEMRASGAMSAGG